MHRLQPIAPIGIVKHRTVTRTIVTPPGSTTRQPLVRHASAARSGEGESNTVFPVPTIPPGGLSVSHDGGTVMQKPKVQLLFWGNAWANDPSLSATASHLFDAAHQIMRGRYLDGMRQYGTGGNGYITGANFVLADPPNPFSMSDVGNLTWALIDSGHFPDPHDSPGPNFYCVFVSPGVNPSAAANGAHSFADDTDVFDTARIWTAWIKFMSFDAMTRTFSHELVEFCSDPGGDGWQVEPRNDENWNEIVDVCGGAAGRLDGLLLAAYYSRQDRACIIPQNPPPPVPPPTLPDGRYRVTCTEHATKNYILAIGGVLPDGKSWMMWEDDAFDRVVRGELSFFVEEAGFSDDLIIDVSFFGFRFFRTRGDSVKANNLGSLRGCDTSAAVRYV